MPYQVEPLALTTTEPMLENSVRAYLLTAGDKALLIDSGFPENAFEINRRLLAARLDLQGIWLTHFHPDHSLGALKVAETFRVDIHCHPLEYTPLANLYRQYFPEADWRRVVPDLYDGLELPFAGDRLTVLHTPGHTHGHIAIFDQTTGCLFAGDHVIPEGTVWIGPPDGHLQDYLDSLDRLLALPVSTLYPGHGEPLPSPHALMAAMKRRRVEREDEIRQIIGAGEWTVEMLFTRVYGDKVPDGAAWAAKKMVVAHLQKLIFENKARMRYQPQERRFYYRAIP